MGIRSVGVDLVEIERIERIINRYGNNFLNRVFTQSEIVYCSNKNNFNSFAVRFAAKEAVFKATGLGLREGMTWQDVEILNNEVGKPQIFLHGKTAQLLKGRKIFLSLSHTKTLAIAFVVVE